MKHKSTRVTILKGSQLASCVAYSLMLGLSICGSLASSGEGSQHPWYRYFPLAVGNTWSYRVSRDDKATDKAVKWKMTQVDDGEAGRSFTIWEDPATGDEGMQLLLSDKGLRDETTGFYLITFPPVAGNEWKYEIDSIRQKRKVEIAYKILSVHEACKSGKFTFGDCIAVEERDEDLDLRTVTYYARDVGPAKLVRSLLVSAEGAKPTGDVWELVSYRTHTGSRQ